MKVKVRKAFTSGGEEPVLDNSNIGHSVFAKNLIKALKNNNEIITGNELAKEVILEISLDANQTPLYSDIRNAGGDIGGDFLFIPKKFIKK